jgi:cytoskeletal protein CcmA (bactofilin family)
VNEPEETVNTWAKEMKEQRRGRWMEMEHKSGKVRDLTITGNGSSIGGEFNRVRIMGERDVNGDLTCNHLSVMGTICVSGQAKSKWTRVRGQIDVDGDFNGEVVKILGQLSVKGDCNSEAFKVRGTFHIGGLLNAGRIEVRLFGPCEAKEIGGGQIHIKRNLPVTVGYKHLTVETVEGDDIRLECTRAKVVRGNRVEIGPGCEIDLVEYKDHYRQSRQASVKESKRV